MKDKGTQTQLIAMTLIFGAAIAIAVGSRFGWHDLVTFAINFGGVGSGILTGHYLSKNNSGDNTANPS